MVEARSPTRRPSTAATQGCPPSLNRQCDAWRRDSTTSKASKGSFGSRRASKASEILSQSSYQDGHQEALAALQDTLPDGMEPIAPETELIVRKGSPEAGGEIDFDARFRRWRDEVVRETQFSPTGYQEPER